MHNRLLTTFLRRNWALTLFASLAVLACLNDRVFQSLGALIYIPAVAGVAAVVAMLIVHLFFRETIDKETHDGSYLAEWRAAPPQLRLILTTAYRIAIWLGVALIAASMAKGASVAGDAVAGDAEPAGLNVAGYNVAGRNVVAGHVEAGEMQSQRWDTATINPRHYIALDRMVALYQRLAPRYAAIERLRANGVPSEILFCLHQRESSGSFACHPHEGSPLTHRTRDVPKGRIPGAPPPYTFLQSAEDAYYVCDRLDLIGWHRVSTALQGVESFNGLGYQRFHPEVPSPYLWSGTSLYKRGKYTADGRFDHFAIDRQPGVAAILKRMEQRGLRVCFVRPAAVAGDAEPGGLNVASHRAALYFR